MDVTSLLAYRGLHGSPCFPLWPPQCVWPKGCLKAYLAGALMLIIADRLVAIEIQSVSNLPSYVENGTVPSRCAELEQVAIDGPRRLRASIVAAAGRNRNATARMVGTSVTKCSTRNPSRRTINKTIIAITPPVTVMPICKEEGGRHFRPWQTAPSVQLPATPRTEQRMQSTSSRGNSLEPVEIVGVSKAAAGIARQDIARQLGAGNTEEDDRNDDPDEEEAGEAIIGRVPAVSGFARHRFTALRPASTRAGHVKTVHGSVASRRPECNTRTAARAGKDWCQSVPGCAQ